MRRRRRRCCGIQYGMFTIQLWNFRKRTPASSLSLSESRASRLIKFERADRDGGRGSRSIESHKTKTTLHRRSAQDASSLESSRALARHSRRTLDSPHSRHTRQIGTLDRWSETPRTARKRDPSLGLHRTRLISEIQVGILNETTRASLSLSLSLSRADARSDSDVGVLSSRRTHALSARDP